ncbi:MAG: hypothetical protein Q4G59_07455, partial [Planctomycetia bacterium]|nr:hypothetical protein [Planctomycetia bacterium]
KATDFFVWLPQIPLVFFNPQMECQSSDQSNQYATLIILGAIAFVTFRLLRNAKTSRLGLIDDTHDPGTH